MDQRAALLKASFDMGHMMFNGVVGDLDAAGAAYQVPGGTIGTSAAIIAHTLFGEDMMVSAVAESPTVLESAGLASATGILNPGPAMDAAWLATSFKLDGLKDYAAAVFARTAAFLESASPAALDRQFSSPLGTPVSAAEYLSVFGLVHLTGHTGELAALKGVRGGKGLPF